MENTADFGRTFVAIVSLSASLAFFGAGCTSHPYNQNNGTIVVVTSPGGTTGTGGPTTLSNGLEFTPQQFVAALAAQAGTDADASLSKSPDLQGANNVVFFEPSAGSGRYVAVDLSVFTGMTLTQAVQVWTEAENAPTQAVTLANGQTLTWGSEIPEGYPLSGGSYGSSGGIVSGGCSYGSTGSGGAGCPVYPVGPVYVYSQGTANVVFANGNDNNGNPLFFDMGGNEYSVSAQTKDVSLQQANIESAALESRAQSLANQFGMSVASAQQLTVLADRMSALTAGGQPLTDQDRNALMNAALGVAGVSADEVNAAATQLIQKDDQTAVDALITKAAANLGMTSEVMLRDQILPSLGIQLSQEVRK